jgi:hypothetical protein
MNAQRLEGRRNCVLRVLGLLGGFALTLFLVCSTSARHLSSSFTGTIAKHQKCWSPGETVLVRLNFGNQGDLNNYTGGSSKSISYKDDATGKTYTWPWLRDSRLVSGSSTRTVVSNFSAVMPDAPEKDKRVHGTGTGTVHYTDATTTRRPSTNRRPWISMRSNRASAGIEFQHCPSKSFP